VANTFFLLPRWPSEMFSERRILGLGLGSAILPNLLSARERNGCSGALNQECARKVKSLVRMGHRDKLYYRRTKKMNRFSNTEHTGYTT